MTGNDEQVLLNGKGIIVLLLKENAIHVRSTELKSRYSFL